MPRKVPLIWLQGLPLYTEAVPMQQLNLKPTHKLVKSYYDVLGQFGQLSIDHEMAVRSAFQSLLASCGRQFDLTLVPEYPFQPPKLRAIRIDGALLNPFRLARGYWEAKDERDDLEKEIRTKLERGYPKSNIIFQAPERAILYQRGMRQVTNEDIRDAKNLVELLKQFFAYREPHIDEWDQAVAEFEKHIPEIAKAVEEKIEEQRRSNRAFVERFDAFYDICRQSINPNLSLKAVETMLVQHLLTERIFRRIFDNPDFARRNVIAVEIEKVIDSMTRKEFSRDAFLKDLDRFYKAVELAAENTETYKEKQEFLNTVYERFFQGYSPKEADTHGIVYTPQAIVDFMVRSVEGILQQEFGLSLSHDGVHILDPFVGTGNFITRVMKEIKTSALPHKYENELHCNEVMLLPYYIASMNIEHEYFERTQTYKVFDGICLVDTFDVKRQSQAFSEENTRRIEEQKAKQIFVIIGNPPYNAWQLDENDNNKKRQYDELSERVAETYTHSSTATNTNALSDVYVKAYRWASDRIGEEGVVAFVSNNGFLDSLSFDGMRKHLVRDFDLLYHVNLKGNARTSGERRRREGGNVFYDAIRVGIGITLLVRRKSAQKRAVIHYIEVGDYESSEAKRRYLEELGSVRQVEWTNLNPDEAGNWFNAGQAVGFAQLLPLSASGEFGMFQGYSVGLKTNRDVWMYAFDRARLAENARRTIEFYDAELDRYKRSNETVAVDDFVRYADEKISWSRDLKADLVRGTESEFNRANIRSALYRPYTGNFLYFDRTFNEEIYSLPSLFPQESSENKVICLTGPGSEKPFMALACSRIVDIHLVGAASTTQCFPFYTYAENGFNRRENITDWALNEFRTHYGDPNITKWDIFHYVYAVLHHPEYRERYAANLKRELPRIPFVGRAGLQASVNGALSSSGAGLQPGGTESLQGRHKNAGPSTPRSSAAADDLVARDDKGKGSAGRWAEAPLYQSTQNTGHGPEAPLYQLTQAAQRGPEGPPYLNDKAVFWAFVEAGRRLADIHVKYEQQPEYPLERVEKGQLNWRVEKMRLSKDKTTLVYNDFLTLRGIPPETYEYRLGNRSALEWVIDQYQVSTDKRSGITNDPNRADDPEYIVRLIGQIITVSLETMEIVKGLPKLTISQESALMATQG
jgi:predicted helicase